MKNNKGREEVRVCSFSELQLQLNAQDSKKMNSNWTFEFIHNSTDG